MKKYFAYVIRGLALMLGTYLIKFNSGIRFELTWVCTENVAPGNLLQIRNDSQIQGPFDCWLCQSMAVMVAV